MFDSLFVDTITVKRGTITSRNALGEPVYTVSNAYTNIPARIEGQNANTQYRKSNERGVNFTIVYIQSGYNLQLQDEVYQGATYLGLISGINEALDATGGTDHWEIIIENP